MRDHLAQFVRRFGITELGPLRGTRIPFGLRQPVLDKVFVAGDAAAKRFPPVPKASVRHCMRVKN